MAGAWSPILAAGGGPSWTFGLDAIFLVAALFLAVKDAAARLAALGPFGPPLTARASSAGWQ